MKLSNTRTNLALTAIVVFALASLSLAQEAHHWSYSGDSGPKHWSEVSAVCKAGHAQSPINITHADQKDLPALEFSYHPAALNVIDNGHTVQVNYAPGSTLKVGDKTYELIQFHFHHKSETAIHGKHSPLEAHLVHKDKDGNLAVVAVLLQEGEANPAVATTWSNIPAVKEKVVSPDIGRDPSHSTIAGEQALLHILRFFDHPTLHRECNVAGNGRPRDGFEGANREVRQALPHRRTSGAAPVRSGGHGKQVGPEYWRVQSASCAGFSDKLLRGMRLPGRSFGERHRPHTHVNSVPAD